MIDRKLHKELKTRTEPLEPGELSQAFSEKQMAIRNHVEGNGVHPLQTISQARNAVRNFDRTASIYAKTSQN